MRGPFFALGLAVLLAACGGSDEGKRTPEAVQGHAPEAPTQARAKRLAVVFRLAELIETRDAVMSDRCPVGDERRPSIGCTKWKAVFERTIKGAGRAEPITATIPRGAGEPRPQMLEWTVRRPGQIYDVQRPPTIFAGGGAPSLEANAMEIAGKDAPPGTRVILRARSL